MNTLNPALDNNTAIAGIQLGPWASSVYGIACGVHGLFCAAYVTWCNGRQRTSEGAGLVMDGAVEQYVRTLEKQMAACEARLARALAVCQAFDKCQIIDVSRTDADRRRLWAALVKAHKEWLASEKDDGENPVDSADKLGDN